MVKITPNPVMQGPTLASKIAVALMEEYDIGWVEAEFGYMEDSFIGATKYQIEETIQKVIDGNL